MLQLSVGPGQNGSQQLNASFTQGDNVAWNFTGSVNNVPINLTGASIRMTVAMPVPLFLSTENEGIEITDPSAGQFQVNISSTESAAFSPGIYPYDLWIEFQQSPPIENQYITGSVTVNQSITAVP